MKTLTIRNVPDEVFEALSERAKRHHRSMQEEMRLMLKRESETNRGRVCEQAAEYRTRFQDRMGQHSVVEDVREDRDR